MFISFLKQIYTVVNNRILFNPDKIEPPVAKQKEYLSSFPEPKDEIEQSFYKYRCLLFFSYPQKQCIILNILSFFALIVLIPLFRLKGFKYDELLVNYQSNNLLLRKNSYKLPIEDIFPVVLKNSYDCIIDYYLTSYSHFFVTKDAFLRIIEVIKRYPFSFHYHVVILVRLAQACFLLATYKPKCITTYVCEREFADPILSKYYESHQVQYHGFMHGDRLYRISEAFMLYNTYWVWDTHYKNLFKSLRCNSLMKIYTPIKNSGIVKPRSAVKDYDYFATYYFGNQKNESIEFIKKVFDKLKHNGYRCKVRPHPRFSNFKLIMDLFSEDYLVEDTSKVTIKESLECSYLTISIKSTVLSQAYYSGKKIVLDDISDPSSYKQLREQEYLFVDKADFLFSELLEDVIKE